MDCALDSEVFFFFQIERLCVYKLRTLYNSLDIVLDAIVVSEGDRFFPVPQVLDRDFEPFVQKRLALGYIEDRLIIEACFGENILVRSKVNLCSVDPSRLPFFEITLRLA